jgi:hypothetical protein
MSDITIPTVKRIQPGMNFGKRLSQLALTVLAVLFVARHINGQWLDLMADGAHRFVACGVEKSGVVAVH